MIAIVEAKRAGLLGKSHWATNIAAGIIVGVVALPLAMAFAIASGVKPEQGIYTAIFAGIIVSLFGGSRVQIAGPTGAFIVILSGVVAQYGVEGLQVATMMAGAILLFLGGARLGALIRFIPAPVIVGFTAGIGVIIWVGQWKEFFGLPDTTGLYFHQKLLQLLSSFAQLDIITSVIAFSSLLLVIYAPRFPYMSRVPGPLVALVIATLVQTFFQFPTVATIGSAFGEIPRGLPSFQLPAFDLTRIIELIGPAFAIAMLGAIESLLSAVVADGMTKTRHNSNQELIGQGLANVIAPLFGGIAATGAIARTATNIRNGGTSPLAGIVHGLVLILILVVLAPLATYIPLSALAAILFVVAWNMSQPQLVMQTIKQAPKADVFILLVTLLLTVFADLVVAVNIGVILAILHFLKKMTDSVQIKRKTNQELRHELVQSKHKKIPDYMAVFSIDGPFFFASVDPFEKAMDDLDEEITTVVLRLNRVPFADGTALSVLRKTIQELNHKGKKVVVTELDKTLKQQFTRMGLTTKEGLLSIQNDFVSFLESLDPEGDLTEISDTANAVKITTLSH